MSACTDPSEGITYSVKSGYDGLPWRGAGGHRATPRCRLMTQQTVTDILAEDPDTSDSGADNSNNCACETKCVETVDFVTDVVRGDNA